MRHLHYGDLDRYTERAMQLLDKDIVAMSRQFAIWGHTKEEVAQELRWHVFRKIEQYDPKKASIRTWGVSICRRRLIDLDRKGYKLNVDVMNTKHIVPLDMDDDYGGVEADGDGGGWFLADVDENILALMHQETW